MQKTTNLFILTALTAAMISCPSARAFQELRDPTLQESLKNIDQSLKNFSQSMQEIKGTMTELQTGVLRNTIDLQNARSEIKSLKDRIAKLEADQPAARRAYYPADSLPLPLPSATGTIMVENQNSTWTATVVVDGTPYVVRPLERMKLDRKNAGTFTYSVIGENALHGVATLQSPVSAVLNANSTYTITVQPR